MLEIMSSISPLWQSNHIIGAAVLAFLLLTAGWFVFVKSRRHPYMARRYLLSEAELIFYKSLKTVLPDGVRIMVKVRLGDVITCSDRDWHAGHGPPIAAKHLDFVLVDDANTRVFGAIELDDKSHARRNRRQRDQFVNTAMRAAGVPLLRQPVQNGYDKNALAAELRTIMQ